MQSSSQAQYFPACVQVSWQAQHFDGSSRSRYGVVRDCKVNLLRTLGGSRSRCGAVHILRSQSEPFARFGWVRCRRVAAHILRLQREPSAHFARVESLSLWRGAHFANPLRTFGGSNRSCCGVEHVLRSRSRDETRDERNASRVVARNMRKTTKDRQM